MVEILSGESKAILRTITPNRRVKDNRPLYGYDLSLFDSV